MSIDETFVLLSEGTSDLPILTKAFGTYLGQYDEVMRKVPEMYYVKWDAPVAQLMGAACGHGFGFESAFSYLLHCKV